MTNKQKAQRSIFLTQLQASEGNVVAIYETVINEANRILLANPTARTRTSIDAVVEA